MYKVSEDRDYDLVTDNLATILANAYSKTLPGPVGDPYMSKIRP